MESLTKTQLQNLQKVKKSPIKFVDLVLGVDAYDYQNEVLDSVAKHNKVAWRSGHGVGKTAAAAWVVLWFLTTKRNSKVITTATSWRQVSKQLWPEIHRWGRKADWEAIGWRDEDFEWLNLMLKIRNREQWFATGEASDDAEKMEGFHADNILYVIDEGKAVPNKTYEAIEGALTTSGAKELVISTPPPEKAGYFYDIFSRKVPGFKLHYTNSEDSPNVSKAWIEARKKDWGEDSPVYITRVRGEFAESSQDSLIPLSKIEEAINRDVEENGEGTLGVDVARFGEDKNAFTYRIGQKVKWIKATSAEDTMQTTGRAVDMLKENSIKYVAVDVVGIGAGVADRLREQKHEVIDYNAGQRANDNEKFKNLRAETYWGLRQRFTNGEISIPDDEDLVSQLSNLKYKFTSTGKIQIESKDDLRKRGIKSPDKADSLAIAFCNRELLTGPKAEWYLV